MGAKTGVNVLLDITSFPWSECAIDDVRVAYISESLSLKHSRRDTGVMRYEFELVTIDMALNIGRGVKAKLSAAVGDTLLFVHPKLSYARGIIPPLGIAAIGTNNKGSKTIDIAGFGEAWSLLAGDYIQADNDTKVYEVAEDTNNLMGTKTVKLTSPLRNSITSGGVITANGVTWHLLSNGIIEASMSAKQLQKIQLTLIAVEKL